MNLEGAPILRSADSRQPSPSSVERDTNAIGTESILVCTTRVCMFVVGLNTICNTTEVYLFASSLLYQQQ